MRQITERLGLTWRVDPRRDWRSILLERVGRSLTIARHHGMAIGLALAVGFVLFVWPLTLHLPLLDPDEGLHAAIAQEMLERGNWVAPTFLGHTFPDKPILFFWALMASIGALGHTEVAVRLPGLLFGALGAIATGLLARELFGGRTGLVAGLLHAAMLAPLVESQAGVHDVALVPWTTCALLFLRRADTATTNGPRVRALALASAFLGLATLTKGLAGVAIVAIAVGAILLVTRRLTIPRALCVGGCILIGASLAAPWYLAMERVQPGYLHYYFVERHLVGYLAGGVRHDNRRWWYYVPVVLLGGFPWIGYVVSRVGGAHDDDTSTERESRDVLGLWTWLCSAFVFLTLGQAKLWTYGLPLFPAIAILAARPWSRAIAAARGRPARTSAASFVALTGDRMIWLVGIHAVLGSLVLPAVAFAMVRRYALHPSPVLYASMIAVAIGYGGACVAFARGFPRGAFTALIGLWVFTGAVVLAGVLPTMAQTYSARDLAAHFNAAGAMPPRLTIVDDRVGSIVFYLDPALRQRVTRARIGSVSMRDVGARITLEASDTVVAVRERRMTRFTRVIGSCAVPYDRAGQFRLYRVRDLRHFACPHRPPQT